MDHTISPEGPEVKFREKEVVQLLRNKHKEDQAVFREKIRQDAFDNQIKVMNLAVEEALGKTVKNYFKSLEDNTDGPRMIESPKIEVNTGLETGAFIPSEDQRELQEAIETPSKKVARKKTAKKKVSKKKAKK